MDLDKPLTADEVKDLGGNLSWMHADGIQQSAADLDPETYKALRERLAAGQTPRAALTALGLL